MQPIPQIALADLTGNTYEELADNILALHQPPIPATEIAARKTALIEVLHANFRDGGYNISNASDLNKIKNSIVENQKKFFYSLLKPNKRQDYFPLSGTFNQNFIDTLFAQTYPIYYHFNNSSDGVKEAFAQEANPEELFPIFADEQYSSLNRLKAAIFYQQQINNSNNNIYNKNKDLPGFKAAALEALTDIYCERKERIFYKISNFITVISNNFIFQKLSEIFSNKLYDLILPSKITDKELLEKMLEQNKQSVIKKIQQVDGKRLVRRVLIKAQDPQNFLLEHIIIKAGIPIALIIAIFLTPSHLVAVPLFSVIGLYLCITTQTRYEARERQGAPEKFAAEKAIKELTR
jgi:hypothetical protein